VAEQISKGIEIPWGDLPQCCFHHFILHILARLWTQIWV